MTRLSLSPPPDYGQTPLVHVLAVSIVEWSLAQVVDTNELVNVPSHTTVPRIQLSHHRLCPGLVWRMHMPVINQVMHTRQVYRGASSHEHEVMYL